MILHQKTSKFRFDHIIDMTDFRIREEQNHLFGRNYAMTISRRTLLKGIGAAPAAVSLFSIPRYAHAAEITLRYGNNLPLTHPLNIRAKEAADRIAKETNGRVEMLIFPDNQLG